MKNTGTPTLNERIERINSIISRMGSISVMCAEYMSLKERLVKEIDDYNRAVERY